MHGDEVVEQIALGVAVHVFKQVGCVVSASRSLLGPAGDQIALGDLRGAQGCRGHARQDKRQGAFTRTVPARASTVQ